MSRNRAKTRNRPFAARSFSQPARSFRALPLIRRRSLALAACLGIALAVPVLNAGTARADDYDDYSWIGSATNLWSNIASWNSAYGNFPNSGYARVHFDGGSSGTSVLVDGNYAVDSINFGGGSAAKAYTIGQYGGSDGSQVNHLVLIQSSNAGIFNATSLTQTVNVGVALLGNAEFASQTAGGSLVIGDPSGSSYGVNVSGNTLTLTGPGAIHIDARLYSSSSSGVGFITNNGANTTFGADNSAYYGEIVNNGGLTIGDAHGSSNPGSDIVVNYGSLYFIGYGSSLGGAFLDNYGTVNFDASSSAGVRPNNNSITNESGGSISFTNAGNFGNTANAGTIAIFNMKGAVVTFFDATSAAYAYIQSDGTLAFNNRSYAESATLICSGSVSFNDTSSAGEANISSSGTLAFSGSSSAGAANINSTGSLIFSGNSSVYRANIFSSGSLTFSGSANAGAPEDPAFPGYYAKISSTGSLAFNDSSTAAYANINSSGTLAFGGLSSAGSSIIGNSGAMTFNNGATAAGASINSTGSVTFNGLSSLGNASLTSSGLVTFTGNSYTGSGSLNNTGYMFFNDASYSIARITNANQLSFNGSASASVSLINNTGILAFTGSAFASNATIFNLNAGEVDFLNNSRFTGNGEQASLNNQTGIIENGNVVNLRNNASISAAYIDNQYVMNFYDNSSVSGSILNNTHQMTFNGSSAASASSTASIITNKSSSTFSAAALTFRDSSSAGNARIDNSGSLSFFGSSIAATAAITVEKGANAGFHDGSSAMTSLITSLGGLISFADSSSASSAVIAISANGQSPASSIYGVDITSYSGTGDLSIGELSGDGQVYLGNNTLTLGGLNTNDTLSGIIGLTDDSNKAPTNGSLTKIGTGTLTLTGANVYAGTTTVSGGTLAAGSFGALGTSALIMNGGTLDLSGVTGGFTLAEASGASGTIAMGGNALTIGSPYYYTTDILGTTLTDGGIHGGSGASLIKTGDGTLILTGTNTYTGTTTVNGGALIVSSPAALGSLGTDGVTVNGGVFGVADPNKPAGSNSKLHNNFFLGGAGSGFISPGSLDTLTLDGSLSGGSLTATGAGTIILTGTNTYSGGTTIGDQNNATTLVAGDSTTGISSSLGSDGPVTNNGTLAFHASSPAGSAAVTNNGTLIFADTSTAGSATIINNARLQFNNQSSAGSATITGFGSLTLNDTASLGSASVVTGGAIYMNGNATAASATITSNFGYMQFNDSSLAGHANITTSGILGFNGNASAGNATIASNGHYASLSFAGSATAANATITNEGYTNFYENASAGAATITNAAYYGGNPNNGKTSSYLAFSGSASAGSATIVNNGAQSHVYFYDTSSAGTATVTNNGGGIHFAGQATADTATVTNTSGAIDLAGLNGGSGGGSVSIGEVRGAGDIDLAGNTLVLGNRNTNDTISGTIRDEDYYGYSNGPGSLTKTGIGTLTLTGANTFSGGTTIQGGTLAARGSALGTGTVTINGGTLAVGQAANTGHASVSTQTLSASALSVTLGNSLPILTFNLGANGTSDTLTLTGGPNALSFSSAASGLFGIGFASAAGSGITSGTYSLILFDTPESAANAPAITSYAASGAGNMAGQPFPNGAFSYTTDGSGLITGLTYTYRGADATPEPPALALLAVLGAFSAPMTAGWAKVRQSRRG